MTTGRSDIMAQAVYLAQLEAARGQCKCRTCQILRKANKAMTDQFLGKVSENPGENPLAALQEATGDEEA